MNRAILRFDMRLPPDGGLPVIDAAQAYSTALEMSAWADRNSIDVIGLSEHHNTDDGFLPAPITLAAAIAARTERVMITLSALLLPLHDPVRVAEDLAVLDLIAGPGRLAVTAGMGYRRCEYDALGRDWQHRAAELEEAIRIVKLCWTGEPFEFRGTTVTVRPRPVSKPHPFLSLGGGSIRAAQRAARLELPFLPSIDDDALEHAYLAEAAAVGYENPFIMMPGRPAATFIDPDPDRAWTEIGPYMLADAVGYARWKHRDRRAFAESSAGNLSELRAEGKYRILTPAEAVDELEAGRSLNFAPLTAGLPTHYGWSTLELFEAEVLPTLRRLKGSR